MYAVRYSLLSKIILKTGKFVAVLDCIWEVLCNVSNANYTCIFLTVKRPVSTTKVDKRSITSSHYKRISEYLCYSDPRNM